MFCLKAHSIQFMHGMNIFQIKKIKYTLNTDMDMLVLNAMQRRLTTIASECLPQGLTYIMSEHWFLMLHKKWREKRSAGDLHCTHILHYPVIVCLPFFLWFPFYFIVFCYEKWLVLCRTLYCCQRHDITWSVQAGRRFFLSGVILNSDGIRLWWKSKFKGKNFQKVGQVVLRWRTFSICVVLKCILGMV